VGRRDAGLELEGKIALGERKKTYNAARKGTK
jgi:hypothetical protein